MVQSSPHGSALHDRLSGLFLLALLAACGPRRGRAHAQTSFDLALLRDGVVRYQAEHAGACPPSLALLERAGYVVDGVDEWGHALVYECEKNGLIRTVSAGADGVIGTRDDLVGPSE